MQFGDVEPCLIAHADTAPVLNAKVRSFFQDVHKNVYLQLELAAVIDRREHFVRTMYFLEGDGPLA